MGNIGSMMANFRKQIEFSEEKDNKIPFTSDKISKIMDYYQLTGKEIYEIFNVFRKMDKSGTGYIDLDNLYNIIGEEVGIISPYLERFFSLMKKQHIDKANFLEFVPVLATFCLYTRQQLISFVFCMLDSDHNGFISKKDMLNFVVDERFGFPIFLQNFLLSIDLMELERPDRISFEQFLSLEQDVLFLIYPVNRLQKNLQKAFGGRKLWESVYAKILKLEKEEEKKNANFQSDAAKKRRAVTADQKEKFFEEYLAKKLPTKVFKSETSNLPFRESNRRGSESRVDAKLPRLLEFSPKRRKSLVYVKRDFADFNENEDETKGHGLKPQKSIGKNKKPKLKLQKMFSLQRKDTINAKGKSQTSLNSSRKKVGGGISRKSSIESMHSLALPALAGGKSQEVFLRKLIHEKSIYVSRANSKAHSIHPSNDGIIARSSNSFMH